MLSEGLAVVPQTLKDAESRIAWACTLRGVTPSSFIAPIPCRRVRCRLCSKNLRDSRKTLERHLETKSHIKAVALELQIDFKSLCGPPIRCLYCEKEYVAARKDSIKRHEKSCKRNAGSFLPPSSGSSASQPEATLSLILYTPYAPATYATPNDYPPIVPPLRPDAPGPYSRSAPPSLLDDTVARTEFHAGPSAHSAFPASHFDTMTASSLHTQYTAMWNTEVPNQERLGPPTSFSDWSQDTSHVPHGLRCNPPQGDSEM